MLVKGSVSEHGVEDVGASAGEADEGGVALIGFGSLAVVVGVAGGVVKGRERGQEHSSLERCLFPPLLGCSSRIDVPERLVTGAGPA